MVQPLHLQDNLSKIPILQKIHESVRIVPEAERDQFAHHLNQQEQTKTQKAQDTKEPEKSKIREREKKEKKKKRKRKKYASLELMEAEQTAEEKQIEESNPGHLIDITV